jgi:branched-chain amino acid transport system substrate-binding protein
VNEKQFQAPIASQNAGTDETNDDLKPITPPSPAQPQAEPPKQRSKVKLLIGIILIVVLAAIGGVAYTMTNGNDKQKIEQQAQKQVELPKVKVGFMMAQSGGAANMGLGAAKGVQLAIKDLGANVELVQVDSMCNATAAADAVKKLAQEKVIAIIGEGCSTATIGALPEANAAKIPMVSPSASSPKLSIADDYFFRTVPPDDFQARYLAEYAYKKGYRRIGQFHTATSPFTDIFKSTFEKLGGKIIVSNSAESNVIDLQAQAKELAAAKPDAITVFTNTATSAVAIINLTGQQGYDGDFFGSDALYDKTIIAQTGEVSEGRLIVSNFTLGTKSFKQSMADAYQSSQQAYAAPQAYDAMHAIYATVQKGARSGEEVKNLLPQVSFDGASGYKIKFDKNGEITGDVKYSLLQVKDANFVEIER